MARKDVELVIRAKEEASKALNSVTTAINSLVDAQGDLKKSAAQSDTALGRLGQALGELDKNLRGATVGAQLAKSLDSASKSAARLEAAVASTAGELDDLQKRSAQAAEATARLKAQAEAAAKSVEKEAAALAKAKDAVAGQSAVLRTATTDRQRLIDAEARLGAQITEQQAKVATAAARYTELGAVIAKTANPTKQLSNSFEAAGAAIEKQESKLNELKVTLGTVRAAIGQTANVIGRLTDEFGQVSATVARQEGALSGVKQEYIELQAAVRAATQTQRALSQSAEQAADSLEGQKGALDRAQSEMAQLDVAAGKANAALAELAAGAAQKLEKSFAEVRAVARQTRAEFVSLSKDTRALSEAMDIIGPPTREQVVALGRLNVALKATEQGYTIQTGALSRLQAILNETGGDVDELRSRLARFAGIQGEVANDLARVASEAKQSGAAYDKLAAEAGRAADSIQRVSSSGRGVPPAAPIEGFAAAWRRVYGESRQALSITQRLRGEVLSLVAAYGGLYGVINILGQVVSAYQTLEAAQSRLNAIFREDPARGAEELDFIRRNADRLGIQFGQLADEYTKFAAATKGTNLEGDKTRKIFISVSEAARVNKLSFEDLQGVFRALTQIASKGRIQLEELSGQLGDRLPGALQIMADGLGITTKELLEMTKEGEVTAESLVGFAEELDRRFGSALAKSLETTTTAMGQMQNAAYQAMIVFAEAGFIEAFTRLIKDLTETMKSADFRAFITSLSSAISVLLDTIGLLVKNFQLVTAAAVGFVGIKLIPLVGGIAAEFVKLRTVLAASAVSFTAANTAMRTSASTAGVATAAFGRLTLAIRALMSSTGIGLVVTAVAVGLSYWATEADAATEALVAHEKTVDQVKNAYDKAAGSAKVFADELKSLSATQIRDELRLLNNALDEMAKPRQIGVGGALESLPQYDEINRVTKSFNDGQMSLVDYRKALDDIAKTAPEARREFIDAFVAGNIKLAESLDEARDRVAKTEAALILLEDPANEAAKAVLELGKGMDTAGQSTVDGKAKLDTYTESIEKLKGMVPELAEELKKLKELAAIDVAYQAAINSAMSIGQANAAYDARQAALDGLDAGEFDKAAKALSGFTSGLEASAKLIRDKESFRSTPYWDVNALRVGFGSDTVTLADGSIRKVVAGMKVSVADANRDLARRIGEFQSTIKGQIGAETFAGYNPQQQAALTSIAYNYGSLPQRIVEAIKTGNTETVTKAIRGLGGDNNGINRKRRNEEAAIFSSGSSPEALDEQIKKQQEIETKNVELAAKQQEQTDKKIADTQFAITQQELINQGKQREAEIEAAIREAKAADPNITADEIEKIRQQTGALFDLRNVRTEDNEKKKEANQLLQQANALMQQRNALEAQAKAQIKAGDNSGAQDTLVELDAVQIKLDETIAKAREMWEALGGGEAQAKLTTLDTLGTKLDTAAIKAQALQQAAQKNLIDWKQVGQLFASGLANAFDKFAQAVANGEDAGEAAKEAFLQFAADFLRQIAQMIIQQAILNALQGLGLGGGGGGLLGGIFHQGGVVGRGGNARRMVNPAVFAGAQRYHDGGLPGLRPGEVPAVLQKGEEVLTGDDPRNILNGGGATGPQAAPQVNVKMVNAIDSPSFLDAALASKAGEKTLINFIRANQAAVKQAIGG